MLKLYFTHCVIMVIKNKYPLYNYIMDRMHVILNGEPLEGVDCFKYLGLQVAADGGCEGDVVHRMNEGYRANWGIEKSHE